LLTKKIGGIMGTQQILLIVLSVVVVGIAVAVGITMFNQQAVNSNRQAVIGDLQNLGAQAMAWYKMPTSMGGGGQTPNNFQDELTQLAQYLGFSIAGTEYAASTDSLANDNGSYFLGGNAGTLEITGYGTEIGNDGNSRVEASLTVNPTADEIMSTTIAN
jgi:hypothetical protein